MSFFKDFRLATVGIIEIIQEKIITEKINFTNKQNFLCKRNQFIVLRFLLESWQQLVTLTKLLFQRFLLISWQTVGNPDKIIVLAFPVNIVANSW